jgi:hypothetical protein
MYKFNRLQQVANLSIIELEDESFTMDGRGHEWWKD